MSEVAENLLEKLKALPPQRLAEAADFVDFLRPREEKTRTRKVDELFAMTVNIAAVQPPLSPEDIQTEIAAARAERRAANADRRRRQYRVVCPALGRDTACVAGCCP